MVHELINTIRLTGSTLEAPASVLDAGCPVVLPCRNGKTLAVVPGERRDRNSALVERAFYLKGSTDDYPLTLGPDDVVWTENDTLIARIGKGWAELN